MNEPSPRSHRSKNKASRSDLLAFLFLILIALAVFWPWVTGSKSFYGGDFGAYFWPNAHLLGNSLRRGVLPLWNPYVLCGTPLVSNPQASLLYPVNVLYYVLSPAHFLMADMALHLLLAGIGCYLLLRRGLLRLDPGAALVGATALMLNGFFVIKMQFPNMVQALGYVPLLLFLTEKVVQHSNGRRYSLALAVALALQLLASNAQITFFSGYLMLAVGLHAWFRRPADSVPLSAVLGRFSGAFTLALALSCVAWLPVLELLRVASRQSLDLLHAARFYLPPAEVTNLFWPHRFGDPMLGELWKGKGDYVETACYAGILPCLLALAGTLALVRRREKGDLFWPYVTVFSIWLSFGVFGLLYILAFFLVPGLNRFHDAVRLLLGAAIAIPVLAAIGWQNISRYLAAARGYSRPTLSLLSLLIALVTVYDMAPFVRTFYAAKPKAEIEAMSHAPGLNAMKSDRPVGDGSGRILRISYYEDAPITNHLGSPYGLADSTYLPRWSETLRPNVASAAGIRDAAGYEPFARRDSRDRFLRAKALLTTTPVTAESSRECAAALSALSVRLVSAVRPKPLPPYSFLRLWKRTSRPYGLFQYYYYNEAFTPRLRLSNGLQAKITSDEPNLIDIALPATNQPYTLNLADTPHPGWHAYLGGKEVDWRAAGSLRAVEIPPAGNGLEKRRASFVFAPETFRIALFISLCALGFLAGCVAWPRKCT